MDNELKIFLQKVIKDNFDIELNDIKLDKPPKKDLGDFAFGTFLLARDLKKSPIIIANNLLEFINNMDNNDKKIISDLSIEGPYLNIKLNKGIYTDLFLESLNNKENLNQNQNKTIIIDYIGANVGKPMHIGHMCTPNLGQAMINIYKKLGYNVISDSHIGDWGIIFGKLITAYKLWGDKDKLEENAVDHLLELYIKVTEEIEKDNSIEQKTRDEFNLLANGNIDSISLWEKFTNFSIKSIQKQLNRLNVLPDYNIGESFYEGLQLPKIEKYPDLKWDMKSIVLELIENNIATKNKDNSVGVIFDEDLKIPSCILQKRDGGHGYLASDLAAIKYRIDNWNPMKIIYFVDIRQQLHLKQTFTISDTIGWTKNCELSHAANGFISLKDGAMSTRKGRIIKLDKLLDEAESRAKKIILEKRDDINGKELDNLSKIIGIGAIKYGYLKKTRESDIIFDWDEFMTFEGNSGPYIQYAYVRALSLIKKSEIDLKKVKTSVIEEKFENDNEIDLFKCIFEFEKILIETTKNNMPHILANYSYKLTKSFNGFYNNVNIIKEDNLEKMVLRLLLVDKFSKILKESFNLLGIDMPEKM